MEIGFEGFLTITDDHRDFPGGPVVKNMPQVQFPIRGRFHIPGGN